MFIEDDELRALYQASSAEHLETVESGLIQLEQSPDDGDTLNGVLRAMHSLKGDSRMLGVDNAEQVVHHMEDLLIQVQEGAIALTPALCDRLYKGLDATRKIATEAVSGEPANLNLFFVLAGLMSDVDESVDSPELDDAALASLLGEEAVETAEFLSSESPSLQEAALLEQARLQLESQNSADALSSASLDVSDADLDALLGESIAEAPMAIAPEVSVFEAEMGDSTLAGHDILASLLAEPEIEEPITAEESEESPSPQAQKSNTATKVESVRVPADKLDLLMTQADELTVTKLGMVRRQEDLQQVYRLWEDWSRELALLSVHGATVKGDDASPQQMLLRMTQDRLAQLGQALVQVRHANAEDVARLEAVSQTLESGIRNLRLIPLSSVFNLFPRMVRDLARDQGKTIDLVLEGGDTLADKRILEELKDPLTHLLRNAIDHGIEPPDERLMKGKPERATIRLRGFQMGDRIGIEITDDGQGLDIHKIEKTALRKGLHTEAELKAMSIPQLQNLIFEPGFSTKTTVTAISGRGVGMDVVRANIQRLKGTLDVESVPGSGCQFRVLINSNLAATHALIVKVQSETFALPIDAVETLLLLERDQLFTFDGQLAVRWQDQPTAVQWLADLLDLESSTPQSPPTLSQLGQKIPCVMMKINGIFVGLLVDQLLDQEHLVLKPKNQFLSQVPNVRGSAILGSGEICMVLEPMDLLRTLQGEAAPQADLEDLLKTEADPKVLLVEDSLVIRTQMIRILSNAGYDVTAAVDGQDGLNKLKADSYDAIVSDVEMPNVSGLEMTETIRQSQEYDDLPIILVTTLADEADKQRGAQAGANAYLTKGDFDQKLLLNTLRRLI